MKTSDFDYHLPETLIAQKPLAQRDASRLLVVHRDSGALEHRRFGDLGDYLRAGDLLVANNSRVIPARLYGRKLGPNGVPGAAVEILLLRPAPDGAWQALVGGRRMTPGKRVCILDLNGDSTGITATIVSQEEGALRLVAFDGDLDALLAEAGHVPLPPYIHERLDDPERYQTIYARPAGSAAAPTAGLHFTSDMLLGLREQGVLFETVTLHVGLDTFQPVRVDAVDEHTIHREWATLTPEAARRINEGKLAGGRLVAVGTTSVRVLETAALRSAGLQGSLQTISARDVAGETTGFCPWRPVAAFEGETDLFLYPGYKFRAVDALITNFHLPQSTLLMLVSAFAGRELMRHAYNVAVAERYRFFSFGDAMLIL